MAKITDLDARKNLRSAIDQNNSWVREKIKILRRDQLLAVNNVEAIRIGKTIATLSKNLEKNYVH